MYNWFLGSRIEAETKKEQLENPELNSCEKNKAACNECLHVKKRVDTLEKNQHLLIAQIRDLKALVSFANQKLADNPQVKLIIWIFPKINIFNFQDYDRIGKYNVLIHKTDLKSAILYPGCDSKGFLHLVDLTLKEHFNSVGKTFGELSIKEKTKIKDAIGKIYFSWFACRGQLLKGILF